MLACSYPTGLKEATPVIKKEALQTIFPATYVKQTLPDAAEYATTKLIPTLYFQSHSRKEPNSWEIRSAWAISRNWVFWAAKQREPLRFLARDGGTGPANRQGLRASSAGIEFGMEKPATPPAQTRGCSFPGGGPEAGHGPR